VLADGHAGAQPVEVLVAAEPVRLGERGALHPREHHGEARALRRARVGARALERSDGAPVQRAHQAVRTVSGRGVQHGCALSHAAR
jgi:hypothetical protein